MSTLPILILGMGISGKSCASYALAQGCSVWAYDAKAKALASNDEQIKVLITKGLQLFDDVEAELPDPFEITVLSPGIPQSHPLILKAKNHDWPVITEVEFACKRLSCRKIAITGTNGKTTACLLTTHLFNQSGVKTVCAGNIGTPVTDLLSSSVFTTEPSFDLLVLELSSFQLEQIKTPLFDTGLILNIDEDHLDRHQEVEAYAKAKLKLANCLLPHAPPLYLHKEIFNRFTNLIQQQPFPFTTFCLQEADQKTKEHIENSPFFFNHDKENLYAAATLCHTFGIPLNQAIKAADGFIKPKHRLEYVATCQGVTFYDDSKATNLHAVEAAIKAIEGRLVLIAGGLAKGTSFVSWRNLMAGKVEAICAIGHAAKQIEEELKGYLPVYLYKSLEEATAAAFHLAKPFGCTVLLCPGCSSLDMFKNYEERGRIYQEEVKKKLKEIIFF